ncbi:hypothetical protein WA158_006152, partial [Blastocystis sp. Blastoise]
DLLLTEIEDGSTSKSIEKHYIDNQIVYTEPLHESEVYICNKNCDVCCDNGLNYSQNSLNTNNDASKDVSTTFPTDYDFNNDYQIDSSFDYDEEEINEINNSQIELSDVEEIKEDIKQFKKIYYGYSPRILLKSIILHIISRCNSQKELYFNDLSNDSDDTFIKVSIFNYMVKTNASSADLGVFIETLRSFMNRFNNDYSIELPIRNTQDYIRSLYHDIPNRFFIPTYLYVCKQNTAIYGFSFQRNINDSMKCIYCDSVHKKG